MNYRIHSSKIKLFIVVNETAVSVNLRNFLKMRFGDSLNVKTFATGVDAVNAVDNETDIVILENYLSGENGNDIWNSIKKKNKNIHLIRLGTNSEISDSIENFQNKIPRRQSSINSTRNLLRPVYSIITYPGRKIAKAFSINEFLALIITSIIFIGIAVALVITLIRY